MKKLNSLATLLICTVLTSGCAATPLEIKQAENEPLCSGNINAKSSGHDFVDPSGPALFAIATAWNFVSRTLHAVVATINPNCYSKTSDSNLPDTSVSNPASSTDKDIERTLNWQPPQAEKK